MTLIARLRGLIGRCRPENGRCENRIAAGGDDEVPTTRFPTPPPRAPRQAFCDSGKRERLDRERFAFPSGRCNLALVGAGGVDSLLIRRAQQLDLLDTGNSRLESAVPAFRVEFEIWMFHVDLLSLFVGLVWLFGFSAAHSP